MVMTLELTVDVLAVDAPGDPILSPLRAVFWCRLKPGLGRLDALTLGRVGAAGTEQGVE